MKPRILLMDENRKIIPNEIDFGVIPAGTEKSKKLILRNNGDADLLELDVTVDSEYVEVKYGGATIPQKGGEVVVTLIAKIPAAIEEPIRPKMSFKGTYLLSSEDVKK